jgi:tyrosine-protein phosphatase non-receptor type 9
VPYREFPICTKNIKSLSLFFLQPSRDVSGAAIALFSASLHNPQAVTHKITLQGIVYQLDAALQSNDTQRNGLVFIYDMSNSKYSNFDYELSQKILTMLKVSV